MISCTCGSSKEKTIDVLLIYQQLISTMFCVSSINAIFLELCEKISKSYRNTANPQNKVSIIAWLLLLSKVYVLTFI